MLRSVRDIARIASETLWFDTEKPIYEFGSRQVEGGGGELANLRSLFPDKRYLGVDIEAGPGVDLVADISTIGSASAGVVLCLETLEHVRNPFKFMGHVERVLDPDGWVLFSTPFRFPIHSRPDYWRITPDGYGVLLENFENAFIFCAADKDNPVSVCALAWDGPSNRADAFKAASVEWGRKHAHPLKPESGERSLLCAHDPVAWGLMSEPSRIAAGGLEFSVRWAGMCIDCLKAQGTGLDPKLMVRSGICP